jgi:peptidoglycan LD-endopeptidase LytH
VSFGGDRRARFALHLARIGLWDRVLRTDGIGRAMWMPAHCKPRSGNEQTVRMTAPHTRAVVVAAAVLSWSCGSEPGQLPVFLPNTPHERYEFAFRNAGLESTALGYQWIMASQAALDEALPIDLPHREIGFFEPTQAPSFGYRLSLRKGQRLIAEVGFPSARTLIFIDLFLLSGDSVYSFVPEAHADSGGRRLDYVIRQDGDYVLRMQPELLSAGRYELTMLGAGSLAFPVDGHSTDNIRSGFGAPRDGGRRSHQGVDIFAPRGTPVLAAQRGYVGSTRGNTLGGKVVWLRTELGSLYYAHLDSVIARRGDTVSVGDTLGLVGNTGNARTTPTHLHFGVYARRPADPLPYLDFPKMHLAVLAADTGLVGVLARSSASLVRVLESPRRRAPVRREVTRNTAMRVLAGTGSWFKVRLPDSTTGFVPASSLEIVEGPVGQELVAAGVPVLDQPTPDAAVIDSAEDAQRWPVLGQFEDYLYVQAPSGRSGWIHRERAAESRQQVVSESR